MYKTSIYIMLFLSQVLIYSLYGKRYYKIDRCISSYEEIHTFKKEFNKKHISAPKKQNKIPAPKLDGIFMKYVYKDDPNDFFHYEAFKSEQKSDTCIVIAPFMCGHSKSKPVRRLINRLLSLNLTIYCLCSRSTLFEPINTKQKKYRGRLSYDDINALCMHVEEKNIILIGQSLGSQQIFMMHKRNAPCLSKIKLLVLMHTYFDVRSFLHIPRWITRRLSIALMKQVEKQREFYLTHGYTIDEVNRVLQNGTLVDYDCIFDIRHLADQGIYTPREYCIDISLLGHLNILKCPTLFIAVGDDIPCRKIPINEIKEHQNISVVIVNRGGHLGTVMLDGGDVTGLIARKYIQLAMAQKII